MIMHTGIYNTVGEVVNAVREAQPEKGVVQYHKLVAKPRDGYPGFFELQTRYHIFWRAGDYAAVKTAEPGVIVKKEHAASMLPFMQWQTDCTEIVWHCKWGLVDCNQCSRQSFFQKASNLHLASRCSYLFVPEFTVVFLQGRLGHLSSLSVWPLGPL